MTYVCGRGRHGHVETHRQPEYYKNQYTRALDEEEKMVSLSARSPPLLHFPYIDRRIIADPPKRNE